MKILSWNTQGLNNHNKQRLLKEKVTKENPDIIFLQETNVQDKN